MKEDVNPLSDAPAEQGAGEMSESEIDLNVEGTFPASDPPAWTLGSDHPSAGNQEHEDDAE